MNTTDDSAAMPPVHSFGRGKDGRKPPGTKGVHAFIPLPNYYRVQAEAALQQLDVQTLVGKLLTETFPPVPGSQHENPEHPTSSSTAMRSDK